MTIKRAPTEADAQRKPRREESCGAETFGKEVQFLASFRLMPKRCEFSVEC